MTVHTRTSSPVWEPITLAQAKLHLRADGTDEDTLISSLIAAARAACEAELSGVRQAAIANTTWRATLDAFPVGAIELVAPLVSVQSVSYTDASGAAQTLTDYQIDTASRPARLLPAPGATWPATQPGKAGAVTVEYTAGYASAAAVPAEMVQWMLLHIGHLFEHREIAARDLQPLPFAAALLDAHRIY